MKANNGQYHSRHTDFRLFFVWPLKKCGFGKLNRVIFASLRIISVLQNCYLTLPITLLISLTTLRWLDTVFQGQHLPSLSINYVAINKVLEKLPTQLSDENLLWSGLQWHRSCNSNEMTLLPILLTEVFLGTGNCSSKIIHGSFFLQ